MLKGGVGVAISKNLGCLLLFPFIGSFVVRQHLLFRNRFLTL